MLRKEIESLIKENCLKLSFKKKKGLYCKDLNDNTIAVVGFGIARYGIPNSLFVYPNIGFIYKDINQLLVEFRGDRHNCVKNVMPMVMLNTGYLMPEHTFKQWQFTGDTDHFFNMNEMFDSIKKYAIPFFEKHPTIDEFEQSLHARTLTSSIDEYLFPIIYYLQGNSKMGLDYINNYIAKQQQPPRNDYWDKGAINLDNNRKVPEEYFLFVERYKTLIAGK